MEAVAIVASNALITSRYSWPTLCCLLHILTLKQKWAFEKRMFCLLRRLATSERRKELVFLITAYPQQSPIAAHESQAQELVESRGVPTHQNDSYGSWDR